MLTIFLLLIFIFLGAVPIFNLLDIAPYPEGNKLAILNGITKPISNITINEAIWQINFYTMGGVLGWFSRTRRNYPIKRKPIFEFSYKFSRAAFGISLSLSVTYHLILFILAQDLGYKDTIHLGLGRSIYLNILGYASVTLLPAFAMILVHADSRARFFIFSGLYLIPSVLLLLIGQRGDFVLNILTLIVLFGCWFGNISIRVFVLVIISIFCIGIYVEFARFGYLERQTFDFITDMFLNNIVTMFLITSGSIAVVAYFIDLQINMTNTVPFFFGYPLGIFNISDPYTDASLTKSYLSQHLTYQLDAEKFYGGSTIGTSTVAEAYELCLNYSPLLIFISFSLLRIASKLIENFQNVTHSKSFLSCFFLLLFIPSLLFSPRGSVLNFIDKHLMIMVTYLVLIVIIYQLIPFKRKR